MTINDERWKTQADGTVEGAVAVARATDFSEAAVAARVEAAPDQTARLVAAVAAAADDSSRSDEISELASRE